MLIAPANKPLTLLAASRLLRDLTASSSLRCRSWLTACTSTVRFRSRAWLLRVQHIALRTHGRPNRMQLHYPQ